MRRRRLNSAIRLIILTLIISAVVFSTLAYLTRELKNSDYFKVKDILVSEEAALDLSYLKGRNIFAIDLERESRYISEFCPTYKRARLVKILPNRLFVELKRRQPVVYIKLYRKFCLDKEGVLFDLPDPKDAPDLPTILGLETKIFGPKLGKRYDLREIRLALALVRELGRNRVLKNFPIENIDLSGSNYVSFIIDKVQVRVDTENFKDKINILGTLFIHLKNERDDIKYIDLRFKEPVINFKDK